MKRREDLSMYMINLKLDRIHETKASCFQCKGLFLYDGPKIIVVTPTEQNIIVYNGKEYTTSDFITEMEQRFATIVLDWHYMDNSSKRGFVSNQRSERSIMAASKQCHLYCIKCNLETTKSKHKNKNITKNKKRDYVNNLKIESKGCVLCGYWNADLLSYFHMDHIDTTTKTLAISGMVADGKYTLDDLIKECENTRVLCAMCHRLHTKTQIMDGLLDSRHNKKKIKVSN